MQKVLTPRDSSYGVTTTITAVSGSGTGHKSFIEAVFYNQPVFFCFLPEAKQTRPQQQQQQAGTLPVTVSSPPPLNSMYINMYIYTYTHGREGGSYCSIKMPQLTSRQWENKRTHLHSPLLLHEGVENVTSSRSEPAVKVSKNDCRSVQTHATHSLLQCSIGQPVRAAAVSPVGSVHDAAHSRTGRCCCWCWCCSCCCCCWVDKTVRFSAGQADCCWPVPVPERPTGISDVSRLERSNSAPSVASGALPVCCSPLFPCGSNWALAEGQASNLSRRWWEKDVTWLRWFHNHCSQGLRACLCLVNVEQCDRTLCHVCLCLVLANCKMSTNVPPRVCKHRASSSSTSPEGGAIKAGRVL